MANGTNNFLVAQNLPTQIPNFIIKGRAVHKAMTAAPYFSNLSNKLNELDEELTKLETAQTGLGLKPPISITAIRNTSFGKVKTIIRTLANDVQGVADTNPENAETIIQSAGFDIKKTYGGTKRQNSVADGTVEGMILLSAEMAGAHQWQQSSDAGTAIVALNPTLGGTMVLTNIVPGVKVWFRNRTILSGNTYGEWTQWLPITPKVF